MKIGKTLGLAALAGAVVLLAGCEWHATVSKKVGQPIEGEIGVKGTFPALRNSTLATISATDLYIDTTGTDFALSTSGMAALTVSDSGGSIIAAKSFAWVRSGTKLVFQDPIAVQIWLNQYSSAAGVDVKLTYGNTPADGSDHLMTTAVVYQGTRQASQTVTFAAECTTRYHTRSLCRQ